MKVLAFGEIMLRLYSEDISTASHLDICYGGTEANVLAALSSFGVEGRYLTVLPNNQLGDAVKKMLDEYKIETSYILRTNGNLGEYYVFANEKERSKATVYNRKHSALANIDINSIDMDKVFKDISLFHISGISFAISKNCREVSFALIKEAKSKGIKVSFDFNYRPALWSVEEAGALYRQVLPLVDIAFLSDLDLIAFLNNPELSKDKLFKEYPNLLYVFNRNKKDIENGLRVADISAYTKDEVISTNQIIFPAMEKIGGGDAFDAGIIYGLINHKPLDEVLDFAISCYVIKHQIKGDILNQSFKSVSDYYSEKRILNNPNILLSVGGMDESFEKMIKVLSEYGNVRVTDLNDIDLTDVDIYIGKKLKVEHLASANRLKAIFAYKTGVDDFPIDELAQRGIILSNSHINSHVIAEYAFGLMVSLINRVTNFDNDIREGQWKNKENPYWKSIFDLKVGLLGYGGIGQAVHKILQMNSIKAYTIERSGNYSNIDIVKDFKELCEVSDVIIASLPKTKETDNLFNKESLSWLKGKYIVNVGRSNVINWKDLYESLRNGELAGFANDVWDTNPVGNRLPDSIYHLKELSANVILSPHQAMNVASGHNAYVEDVIENVIAFIKGRRPRNIVDSKKGY